VEYIWFPVKNHFPKSIHLESYTIIIVIRYLRGNDWPLTNYVFW